MVVLEEGLMRLSTPAVRVHRTICLEHRPEGCM